MRHAAHALPREANLPHSIRARTYVRSFYNYDACNGRGSWHGVVVQQAPLGSSAIIAATHVDASFVARLGKCADLPSIHALLLEQANGCGKAPTEAPCSKLVAATRPTDVVSVFNKLSTSWSTSAQGPVDAATLSDALQYAYGLLKMHMNALSQRDAAAILLSLARLRSASPEVLRQLADSIARKQPQQSPDDQQQLIPQPPPASRAAATDQPPSSSHAPSSAQGLARLPYHELAQVVSALATFNVRPGDAWLGASMSCLQLGLPALSGPQLAQLLWALVQLGVRPTSPWLALFEDALNARLAAQQQQQQQPRRQHPKEPPASMGASSGNNSTCLNAIEVQNTGCSAAGAVLSAGSSTSEGGGGSSAPAAPPSAAAADGVEQVLSCEDLVRVLRAAAEVGFQPGERCRAALLAASGGALRGMQAHQLAGLAWAVARLRWRVGEAWSREFLQVTQALLPQLRPSDLPPVLSFLAASRLTPSRSWLRACLAASAAHLPQVSPRDLPALLLDLTQLQPSLFAGAAAAAAAAAPPAKTASPSTPAVAAAAAPPAAPSPAGSEVCEAADAPSRQEEGGSRLEVSDEDEEGVEADVWELRLLAGRWLRSYLAQCVEKLPRFTAAGVAALLRAVARAGVQPERAWLRAVCAALGSKIEVLGPSDLADAVVALAALRQQAGPPPPPPPPPSQPTSASNASRRSITHVRNSNPQLNPNRMQSTTPSPPPLPQQQQQLVAGGGGPLAAPFQGAHQAYLLGRQTGHMSVLSRMHATPTLQYPRGSRSSSQVLSTPHAATQHAAAAGTIPVHAAPYQGLIALLLASCATKLSLLSDEELVQLAAAAAALDVRPSAAWLQALFEESQARLEAAAAAAASAAAAAASNAASRRTVKPPKNPTTRRASKTTARPAPSLHVVSSLPPRLLGELLVAVAKLDVQPPARWLTAFLAVVRQQLVGFDAASLSGLVWGLVVLEVRLPPDLTRQLLARVRVCLREEQEEGLGGGGGEEGGQRAGALALAWAPVLQGLVGVEAAAAEGDDRVRTTTSVSQKAEGGRGGRGIGRPSRPGVGGEDEARGEVTPVSDRGGRGAGVGGAGRGQGQRRQSYGYLAGPYSRRRGGALRAPEPLQVPVPPAS